VLILLADYQDASVQALAFSGIPAVTMDFEYNGCAAVFSDNVQGMQDLVTYVYSMGHRKIAFIHGDDAAVTRIRIDSFYRTCRDLGIEVPPEYVIAGIYHNPSFSAQATRQLLALPEPPTCILYPDDISYIGGINELTSMGLSVPEDISVAGYDGIWLSQAFPVKSTTLQQDADGIGIRAAEELARAVEEGKSYIPGRIMIPGRLIPGDTVKNI
jgi:LacI family transcriptional regulator